MADPEHAMVFIDNHDNQRGHGGGGNLLTHEDPWNYKIGSSFMLAHDYGFKRVMSSYYFHGDTDAGPPSSSPHSDCGGAWACEHRYGGRSAISCVDIYRGYTIKSIPIFPEKRPKSDYFLKQ